MDDYHPAIVRRPQRTLFTRRVSPQLFPLGAPTVDWGAPESFTSYSKRLARAHSTTVPALIARASSICRFNLANARIPRLVRSFEKDSGLDGYNSPALMYHRIIRGATRPEHFCGATLEILRPVLCVSGAGAVHHRRKWCVECYAEMRKAESPLFDPLEWSLSFVLWCPRHRTPLRDQCGRCGRQQSYFTGTLEHDRCCSCGESLLLGIQSEVEHLRAPISQPHFQTWAIDQAHELMDIVRGHDARPIVPNAVSEFIRALIKCQELSRNGLARRMGVSNHQVTQWLNKRSRPRLDCLAVALANLGTGPARVFTSPKQEAGILPLLETSGEIRYPMRNKVILRKHDRAEILARLNKMRKDPKIYGVVSRNGVVRLMGMSQGALTFYAPHLLQQFAAAYMRNRARATKLRRQDDIRSVDAAIKMLVVAGKDVQRRDVVELLESHYGVPMWRAKVAYGAVRARARPHGPRRF